jgi:hypothetical protein
MKLNIYIDGSWLFKQCDKNRIFANRTESPGRSVSIDFSKLLALLEDRARLFYGPNVERGNLLLCTSIFSIPADAENWPEAVTNPDRLPKLRANVHARETFAQSAVSAGFSAEGLLRPTLRPWVLRAISAGDYQEKQVDTWLVAHLVERAVTDPESVHFVATGDADMMPGIQTVVPRYTERVAVVATHPLQFDQAEQQTSFAFESFGLRYGPIYLEDSLDRFISGNYVYRCRNPACSKIFTRSSQPSGATAGFCVTHESAVRQRGRGFR